MNTKPPPATRGPLPSPPPHSPLSSPQPIHPPLPALPFHPPHTSPSSSPPPTYAAPPPSYNYAFPHPLSILSCADLPPPTFSSNYHSAPTFKAEFRAPFYPPQHGHHHQPQQQQQANAMQHFHQQYRTGANWGVVEGGRLSGDAFATEGQVGMGAGCGWWSRKIVYYSGGQPVTQTGPGYGAEYQGQWQSPTPPGSPGPGAA
ncbi:hypothetical protein BJ508DRAFT_91205 [Ascobolus immersus RN42]|uniref:Uncharacterized protein n=1 Tax=Ascobolus immersus RN42 TaxID=1160509 RepID=A0A3N4IDT6_ASCIM|nr:hypothetical protein BJ508DRAFT_91205 [Ascobolus immersus RN42]